MGRFPRVPIPGRMHHPFRAFQPGPNTRGGAEVLSDLWADFDGSTTIGDLDALAAAQVLHSQSGNYSYAMLVKGNAPSFALELLSAGDDVSPSVRLVEISADKCTYWHKDEGNNTTAFVATTQAVFDATIHLVIWTTKDSGVDGDLFSQVDDNATVSHGAGTDPRDDGVTWNATGPAECKLGRGFTGQIGWIGMARAQTGISTNAAALNGTGGADLAAAYAAGGRRALHDAWVTANAAASWVAYSHVLDGIKTPDIGGATPIVWTAVTYTAVEV